MSRFDALVGPSYRLLSKYAAVERCVNWFPEIIEDPHETKSRATLCPTPNTGKLGPIWANFPDQAIFGQKNRGLLELNGRVFVVNGDRFFEYLLPSSFDDVGAAFPWGIVQDDGQPVTMVANGVVNPGNQQIFICSADKGYIFETGTNTFTHLTAEAHEFQGGRTGTFLDNFFVTLIPGTNGVQVSNQNDGLHWSTILGQAIAYTEGQSDVLAAVETCQEFLYIFGTRRGEIWYNNGGDTFPFSIQPGAFIETGLGGQSAVTQADNAMFFLGQDKRGGRSIWRLNGATPVRVSTFAVELALQNMVSVSDCIMYSFLWRGHIFVRCIFPTAGVGWTYDVTTSKQMGFSVWHENNLTDSNGDFVAPIERSHCYTSGGVHIVGSGGAEGTPGTLYQFTDATTIDENPVLMLRYSNDAGNTYLPEKHLPVGKAGDYETRCLSDLLGSARDRVFWIRAVDYGDAGGTLPVTRDRICPHIFNENKRIFYGRLEIELQKGIGAIGIASQNQEVGFWCVTGASLEYTPGLN